MLKKRIDLFFSQDQNTVRARDVDILGFYDGLENPERPIEPNTSSRLGCFNASRTNCTWYIEDPKVCTPGRYVKLKQVVDFPSSWEKV